MRHAGIRTAAAVLAIGMFGTAGCGGGGNGTTGTLARSKLARDTTPAAPKADVESLVNSNTAFAIDLYRQLQTKSGNFAFSPASISTALTMLSAGARGQTLAQIRATLHLNLPAQRQYAAANALDLALAAPRSAPEGVKGDPLTLVQANSVWAQNDYPFIGEFLDLLARDFGAGIFKADFVHAAETERKRINAWVSEHTKGKITDLLPQGIVDDLTRMVLVNALYFHASWKNPFDAAKTGKAVFHTAQSDEQVPTMNTVATLPYATGDGWVAADLPYIGDASMTLIVPTRDTMERFESSFNVARLQQIYGALKEHRVTLALPKFAVHEQFALKTVLRDLGLVDVFEAPSDTTGADLTGITKARELYVTAVQHEAAVSVDEKGTEAAAATAVVIGKTSAPPPATLQVDRPFLYVIRDTKTGEILFLGRVANPAA